MFLARRSILVLFVFFNCCTARADEAPLLWKFAAGDEHPYRMIQNMDMIMTPPSGEIKTGVKQQIDMTWRIEAVDEAGAAVVTQRIVRVQMDMEAPGPMEIHYDTASEKAPTGFAAMLAPMFKAMSDSPFKWTMSPRGEISNVEIPPGVGEALKKLSGGAMMGDLTTDKGFKQMMQQQVLILPNPGELQPGYKWSTAAEMENPQFGTISTKMSYTYQGPRTVKGEEFEVFKPQLELQFGEGKGGVSMDIFAQKTSGEVLFNRTAGRLESSTLNQETSMSIGVGDQNVEQKMVQTMKLQRVAKPETKE